MLDRRTFVLGAAATAALVTTTATPARAAAAAPGETAGALLAPDGTPAALTRVDGQWALLDESGSVRITTGLGTADLVDATVDGDRLVAVGSLGGDQPVAAIWESTDGTAWHEVRRLHGVGSQFTAVGGGLALGSVVKQERASVVRIAARRTASGWATVRVRGLEWTDGLAATAVARTPGGWVAAAVDRVGTVLHTSADGVNWTARPRLDGVAVRGLAALGGGVHWVGNELVEAVPLTGFLDADRRQPAVPADAKALGVVGARSAWLAGGRLITAEATR
ncbi:hypothetical protein [Saccharothrix syringae]|uniref:Exo-alpha-sialidase n=1 Tax=Saccharothrix syringae TaxID=103733 RepID=A0A5Q0GZG8_SACSY|nr:hypothetical protein [Saccharothrix syringae]QFZ19411.1 hypothetical protein EKG83_19970 [Saccharothrix syringae]